MRLETLLARLETDESQVLASLFLSSRAACQDIDARLRLLGNNRPQAFHLS